jgi:hypothetical protein
MSLKIFRELSRKLKCFIFSHQYREIEILSPTLEAGIKCYYVGQGIVVTECKRCAKQINS